MSKVFIPQFSPPAEPPREFVSQGCPPGQDRQAIFPMEWPHLQSRENRLEGTQPINEKEEKILKQAREKALLIEMEAYEKGFAQGEKDGLELSQKRFEPIKDSFGRILEKINQLHRDLFKEYEGEMVQIVFAITRKILRYDWPLPEAVVKKNLQAAFQYVMEPRKVVVRLNPKDCQHLFSHPGDFPWDRKEEGNGIIVVPDPSVTRGGCFLETSFGDIDGTLETQLDQIISQMSSKVDPPNALPERSIP